MGKQANNNKPIDYIHQAISKYGFYMTMHISLQPETSMCDWFFNFAHQGDHFTILTGLAHSRLETLGK